MAPCSVLAVVSAVGEAGGVLLPVRRQLRKNLETFGLGGALTLGPTPKPGQYTAHCNCGSRGEDGPRCNKDSHHLVYLLYLTSVALGIPNLYRSCPTSTMLVKVCQYD